jgi:hypothetical protein
MHQHDEFGVNKEKKLKFIDVNQPLIDMIAHSVRFASTWLDGTLRVL